MSGSMLIGREKEIALLKKYNQSPKSEMIAVYGRRKVVSGFVLKPERHSDVPLLLQVFDLQPSPKIRRILRRDPFANECEQTIPL